MREGDLKLPMKDTCLPDADFKSLEIGTQERSTKEILASKKEVEENWGWRKKSPRGLRKGLKEATCRRRKCSNVRREEDKYN